jgi:hypothetical protein
MQEPCCQHLLPRMGCLRRSTARMRGLAINSIRRGQGLYNRDNAVLERVLGNKGRAVMTVPELDAALAQGLAAIALLPIVFFMIEGISKVVLALTIRPFPNCGWVLASGLVGILLALRERRGDAGLVLGAADTRRHIIGDDRHERAVGRRLQPPRYRHGSSKLRIFGEELDR